MFLNAHISLSHSIYFIIFYSSVVMSPIANCFDAYIDIKMYRVVYAMLLYRPAATHRQKQLKGHIYTKN